MLFRNNMSKTFSWDFACISPEKSFSKKERSIHLQEKSILLSSGLEKESVKQIPFKQIVILWYRAENLIKPIPWSSVPLLLDLA